MEWLTQASFFDDDLKDLMKSYGLIPSQIEPSIYIKKTWDDWLKLLNYIDDQLYFGSSDNDEKRFEQAVRKEFDMDPKGDVDWYLSMSIQRLEKDYIIDQTRYCLNLLKKINLKIVLGEDSLTGKHCFVFVLNSLRIGVKLLQKTTTLSVQNTHFLIFVHV